MKQTSSVPVKSPGPLNMYKHKIKLNSTQNIKKGIRCDLPVTLALHTTENSIKDQSVSADNMGISVLTFEPTVMYSLAERLQLDGQFESF